MEPWKQCAQWLIHCKVLPTNHRVTWDSAQVFDLAQTLRDGVLLCQLLNNLRAHSINLKEINLRPQMSQRNHDINEDSRKWRAFGPVICPGVTLVEGKNREQNPEAVPGGPERGGGWPASSVAVFTALPKPCEKERVQPLSAAKGNEKFH
ncbi:hypothetical protein P7K49_016452 [Saguinus oedipus]|uniref:Calponin-homology (CH) domain-containing protein n=1 Tax=Saguinus oedipus TaxID=9490 RepID=A0ABQ9VC43_SAGOE|nr:hypothetical protein P7K49_016452 [Saguinus oedipus]